VGCNAPAPPPPAPALSGGGVALLVLCGLALCGALGGGVHSLLVNLRAVEQRRRLLALTQSYQALSPHQPVGGEPQQGGGYYGRDDGSTL